MLKLKHPVQRDITLRNGTKITVEAEVQDEFLIHAAIYLGELDYRHCQVTHANTSQACAKCKNITSARKVVKLLKGSGIDWTVKTADELKADQEKLKAAHDLIKEFRI